MDPVTIIAEVGLAHEGSLALAHSYIDAAARAGADIIKFQLHLPEEGTDAEPFRTRWSTQDHARSDYWRRTGFHIAQWKELRQHVEDAGKGFMLSVFCEEAVAWAHAAGCRRFKVPSGQMNNFGMHWAIANQSPEHVYLSLGLSSHDELLHALTAYDTRKPRVPVTLLHCVTSYPTPPQRWRLDVIPYLASHYNAPVGFSDHSGTTAAGLMAASVYSVPAIEVHVTFDKRLKLPDTRSSLTFEELQQLVLGVRAIELSRFPEAQDLAERDAMRRIYMPSLVAKTSLKAGTVIDMTHVLHKKTGDGPRLNWWDVMGKTLRIDVPENHVFTGTEFEESKCAASA